MIILDCEQYSDEWYTERLGVPTVSQFIKIITASKNVASKQQEGYLFQLATEQVTGVYAGKDYQSYAMKQGHEREEEARSLFSMIHDVDIRTVGLVFPDEQKKYAGSPDGLIESWEAGLEIFCPESPNAVRCLFNHDNAIALAGKTQQIQGSLLVTGFEKWFFMSYYPGLKPLILEVKRDEDFILKLEAELDRFTIELASVVKTLKGMS